MGLSEEAEVWSPAIFQIITPRYRDVIVSNSKKLGEVHAEKWAQLRPTCSLHTERLREQKTYPAIEDKKSFKWRNMTQVLSTELHVCTAQKTTKNKSTRFALVLCKLYFYCTTFIWQLQLLNQINTLVKISFLLCWHIILKQISLILSLYRVWLNALPPLLLSTMFFNSKVVSNLYDMWKSLLRNNSQFKLKRNHCSE